MRLSVPKLLLGVAASILAACGGGGDNGGNPTQPPGGQQGTLTLSSGSPAILVSTGGSGTANVSIVRGGGFAGTVTLAVSGTPTGVTASLAPASLDANTTTSTLTVTAAANAAAGVSTLTVTATGSGVTTQTTNIQLVISQPTIALTASPATLSVTAGQQGSTVINISRSTGFAGAVTLALVSPPAGITGTFTQSPTTAITSSLTIAVASTVAAGNYTLAVRGSATGVQDNTTSVTLTVVASGPVGFTLAVDPVEFDLPAGRGWNNSGIVSIQRTNGFTGPVSVTVQGLQFPAVVAVTPASITANATASNMLALTIDGAAPGVYTGTVRASAPGFADQTAQVRVRVSLPTTGSISWNFCRSDRVPRFLAVRDGNGAWKHIVADGPWGGTAANPTRFSFDITQSTGAVAIVWLGEKTSGNGLTEGFHWNVYYMTRQEIVDLAAAECIDYRDTNDRRASGTVTGYQAFDALLANAGRFALATVGSTNVLTTPLTMQNLPPGPFDLLLSRTSFVPGQGPDPSVLSLVLRRGLDPANNATVAPVNFTTEGFAPASAALTFANTNGETYNNTMTFRTADGLNAWLAASGYYNQSTRTWWGVPANRMIAGDMHQVTATTTTAGSASRRQIIHFATNVSPTTLTFGPALSLPTVTPMFTPAWGIRASGTLGPDYTSRASMYLREQGPDPRTMVVVASRGFLGGQTQYTLEVPDLTAATGFTNFWNLRRGQTVKWVVTGGQGGTSDVITDAFCMIQGWYCPVKPVAGTTYLSASMSGTITIP